MDRILINPLEKLKVKETRWDRIRKRHINSLNIKTETVKKFIEMDFIGKKNMKLMNGDIDPIDKLNPALVMDLRHEMIERLNKKKTNQISIDKQIALEKVKSHNDSVENHYIENELTKFKTEMENTRKKLNKRLQRPQLCLNLTTNKLFNSLKTCTDTIEDFYEAPIDAIRESTRISDDSKELMKVKFQNSVELEDNQKDSNNSSDSTTAEIENIVSPSPTTTTQCENQQKKIDSFDRCVRFEESVQVISYSRQESFCSTSDDVDSVISELADEVLHEIEKDTQIEMIGKRFDSLQITATKNNNNSTAENEIEIIHKEIYNKETLMNNKEIVFAINDDLLRITKVQPESNEIKLIVEMQSNNDDEETITPSNSESGSNEQNAIIAELFRPKQQQQQREILLRQSFLKWIHFTTLEKIEKDDITTNRKDRLHKINAFLDKMRKEKNKIPKNFEQNRGPEFLSGNSTNNIENREKSVVITKKYQNKIKVQQDIIELQKLKLERQERMIMELKLNKLSEDTKLSKQDIKNELKAVIQTGNIKHRTKAKSLQLVGNLRDEEDDELARLQGRAYLMPKFLEKMQERALERGLKHEQARQRRLQREAEKEALKIAAEEAKRAEDEEAKRLRIEVLKEKRRQEKQAKIQKERDRQRYIDNMKKSEDFCRRRFLRRFGMDEFKKLLAKKRKNYKKSEIFRRNLIKRKIFKAWFEYYIILWENKHTMAIELYGKIIKRLTIRAWIYYSAEEKSKFMVAIDWYELKLNEFIFKRWLAYTKMQAVIEESKSKKAESHYQWHLKWKVLDRWQRLPQILKLEKETEIRRERWRLKIWELLPDYTPNRNDDHNFGF